MIVSLIVAVSENGVIGKNNDLIWHLPKDMKYFKEKTLGHHIIMGRKNFESIPHKFRPLRNRVNIIVTRNKDYKAKDCIIATSIESAIDYSKSNKEDEVFIIGGGEIYKQSIQKNLVDKIYLTRVHADFDGDTFFETPSSNWIIKSEVKKKKDEKHLFDYTFLVYTKN
jgi:dihydrofolate reductase